MCANNPTVDWWLVVQKHLFVLTSTTTFSVVKCVGRSVESHRNLHVLTHATKAKCIFA